MLNTRKHIARIFPALLLAIILCLSVLFPRMAYAKNATTITVTDTLMNIGDSIDLRDIVSVTSGYDGTLQFVITQTTYADAGSIVGNRLYIYKSGRITITVTAPETTKYAQASEILYINVMGQTLSFQPANQTVSLSTKTVDLKAYVTMPSDYTGTLTFTSANKDVATVKGSVATLLAAGTTKITVTAPATEIYTAAKKTFDLTVTAQTTTISVTPVSVSADIGTINLNSYVSAGSYPGTFTYAVTQGASIASLSGSTLTISGAGTVKITVTAPAAGGYTAATADMTVTIMPATAITGFKSSAVTVGSTLDLSTLVTQNSRYSGTITYTVISGSAKISGSILTPTGAGAIVVRAQTGATSMFSASDIRTTITASRKSTTISALSVSKYRDETPIKLSSLITLTSGYDGTLKTTISGSSISISGDVINYTGIGASTVTVVAPQTDAYEAAQTTFTVTVKRRTTAITASDITKYRDDTPVSILSLVNITSGYNGTITATSDGGSVSIVSGMLRYNSAGSSIITVTAPQTDVYEAASTSFRVTVIMRESSLIVRDITLTQDNTSARIADYYTALGSTQTVTYRITEGADRISLTNGTVRAVTVGTAKIQLTLPESTGYSGTTAEITVTVKGKKIQMTNQGDIQTEYGATPIRLSDWISITPVYDGEITVTIGGDAVQYKNGLLVPVLAGSASVSIKAPATTWCEAAETSFTVNVAGKSPGLRLQKSEISVGYGNDTYLINDLYQTANGYDGIVDASITAGNDVISISQGKITLIGAGTAALTITAGATKGYLSEEKTITFTVRPISPQLTVKPAIAICGGSSIDLSKLIAYADSSKQKPQYTIESGKELAAVYGSHLKVTSLGEIRVKVTLPAEGPYDTESDIIPVTVVEVLMEKAEAEKKFYNTPVDAAIRILGTNFQEEDYPSKILSAKGGVPDVGEWKHDGNVSTLPLKFNQDGAYSFHSPEMEDDIISFVVDQKEPVLEIIWSPTPNQGTYFNEATTAMLRIMDENPLPGEPEIYAQYEDKKISIPKISEWKREENGLSATITFTQEGQYKIGLQVKDQAGNISDKYETETIIIDLTPPTLMVTGVEDGQIYKEEITVRISSADENIGDTNAIVSIQGVRNEKKDISCTDDLSGVQECVIAAGTRELDDAYTMTVTCTDLAGNTAIRTIKFGINCFGSEYNWENQKNIMDDATDIIITESNVSPLISSTVTIGCNGTTRQLNSGADYEVSERRYEGLYLYRYVIHADSMREDGYYEILLNSIDEAENRQSNTSKGCPVRFVVDSNDPDCLISGLENGKSYNASQIPYQVIASDNISLDRLVIYVNDEEIATYTAEEMDLSGGKIHLIIEEQNDYQTIKAEAVDAAGRKGTMSVRVLVATNPFVRFWNNKTLVTLTAVGMLLIIGGLIYILFRRKRTRQA